MNVWRLGTNWGGTAILEIILTTKVGFYGGDWEREGVQPGDYVAIAKPGTKQIVAIGIADSTVHPLSELLTLEEKTGKLAGWVNCAKGFRFKSIWNIPESKWFSTADYKQFYSLWNDDNAWEQTVALIHYFQEREKMEDFREMLKNNLILTGAPGTGKTYLAWQIACSMTGDPNPMEEGNELLDHPHIGFCQFHPSMDYTDFVEGIRPIKPKEGNENIGFEGRDGIFKAFCRKAAEAQKEKEGKNYVFIIDEINRGDISKIFGELFFAIDPGYRGKKGRITTQYANLIDANSDETNVFKDGFYVPDNVFIIGTMNDIDRGVESMDFAIRRRFAWREIKPEETQKSIFASKDNLKNNEGAQNRMDNLNAAIREDSDLGSAFQIGGAYFKKLDGDNYTALWKNHLEPLLREYLRGQTNTIIEEKMKVFKAEFNNAEKKSSTGEKDGE